MEGLAVAEGLGSVVVHSTLDADEAAGSVNAETAVAVDVGPEEGAALADVETVAAAGATRDPASEHEAMSFDSETAAACETAVAFHPATVHAFGRGVSVGMH